MPAAWQVTAAGNLREHSILALPAARPRGRDHPHNREAKRGICGFFPP
jgi:hypothetical protein